MKMFNEATNNFVKNWILPKGFQDIIVNLLYTRRNKNREHLYLLEENKKIKDIYKGKRCFIIGNGPSLKHQDLNKLEGEYTFAVSHFFMTDLFTKINPFGYVVADPALFDDSDFAIEWLTKLDQQCKNQSFFFPINAVQTIQKYNMFQNRRVYYLDMSSQFDEDTSKFDIDLTKKIPSAQTVIIMVIMIAAYMGFKEIYLIGCDSDWAKYPSSRGYLPHFYNEDDKVTKPKICPRKDWKYEDVLNAALIIFKSYRLLGNKLQEKDTKIYNATGESFLDMFERINYESIWNDHI